MQKIILLILLAMSSLVGIEKNSMDCSDTPDWVMSEADKKYLCKENDSSKKAHIEKEWLKVSSTLCADNDGKNDHGQCEATWEDAQKMCKALDARLPTIEELSVACPSNTKNLDENIKDLKYQECYKSQGFSTENYYWSSTVDEVDPGKTLAYYLYVGRKMAYKQNYGFYVRCLKNEVAKKSVSEKKKPLEKSYLSPNDDKKDTSAAIVYSLDPNGDGFLSIRTKPKGREIGKLYNGDKVKILSKKGKYYKIEKVSSGMVGYAHSNWIRKTSSTSSSIASTPSSNKVGVVQGLDPNGDGFLALRAKYKTGRQIGKLYEGDKVKILAKRGKWYKVKTVSAGQVGWAHGNWVRETSSHSTQNLKNTTINKWITPSKTICEKNGGKIDDNGYCTSTWTNAKKICLASGGELASIKELKTAIRDCGGVIDSDNIGNESYQKCYEANGFASNGYWSSTTSAGNSDNAWLVYFDDGNRYGNLKYLSHYVRCVRAGQ